MKIQGVSEVLGKIEAGDKVWLGDNRQDKRRIAEVIKVTPTQIVLKDEARYYRMNGREVGGSVFNTCIKGIATPSEIKAYQDKLAEEKLFREASEKEMAERERLRTELYKLFEPMNVVLSWTGNGCWEVTFHDLKENDVREIATLMTQSKMSGRAAVLDRWPHGFHKG